VATITITLTPIFYCYGLGFATILPIDPYVIHIKALFFHYFGCNLYPLITDTYRAYAGKSRLKIDAKSKENNSSLCV